MLNLLDEECRFPRATDATFLQKIYTVHDKNPLFAKSRVGDSKQFGVSHYSGLVSYDVGGFLDKNRDNLQVYLSIFELLYTNHHTSYFCWSCANRASINCYLKCLLMKKRMVEIARQLLAPSLRSLLYYGYYNFILTLSQEQLTTLMKNLSLTMPHYVRYVNE